MDRGDVLVFNTDKKEYKDWKYFRAIETVTKYNKEEGIKDTGSKLYIGGNVMTKNKEVLKQQLFLIGDFFILLKKGEVDIAEESDQAIIFLTDVRF